MIKGVTKAGLGQVGSLEELITLAAEHGFGAVDVNGQELAKWIEDKGLSTCKQFLREKGIIIGSIGLSVEWRGDEAKFLEGLPQLLKDAQTASSLGCFNCCTYVLPSTDYNAAHFMAIATRRLRTCAQLLKPYGMRLGLEFVGPHHLRTRWEQPFIWDMDSTLDWIEAIDESNVGLLFDSYHWYTTEADLNDILRLKADQIVHVHINDAPNVPVEEVLDNNRLYPGEGVINLTAFLQGLDQIGYQGVVSQEILTPNPLTESCEVLIKKSAEAFRNVYRKAGLE